MKLKIGDEVLESQKISTTFKKIFSSESISRNTCGSPPEKVQLAYFTKTVAYECDKSIIYALFKHKWNSVERTNHNVVSLMTCSGKLYGGKFLNAESYLSLCIKKMFHTKKISILDFNAPITPKKVLGMQHYTCIQWESSKTNHEHFGKQQKHLTSHCRQFKVQTCLSERCHQ